MKNHFLCSLMVNQLKLTP